MPLMEEEKEGVEEEISSAAVTWQEAGKMETAMVLRAGAGCVGAGATQWCRVGFQAEEEAVVEEVVGAGFQAEGEAVEKER